MRVDRPLQTVDLLFACCGKPERNLYLRSVAAARKTGKKFGWDKNLLPQWLFNTRHSQYPRVGPTQSVSYPTQHNSVLCVEDEDRWVFPGSLRALGVKRLLCECLHKSGETGEGLFSVTRLPLCVQFTRKKSMSTWLTFLIDEFSCCVSFLFSHFPIISQLVLPSFYNSNFL